MVNIDTEKCNFINLFNEKIKIQNTWKVKGIIDDKKSIYSLGSDTKILSRIFEILTYELLVDICKEHNWILETPKQQTIYPDFTIYKDRTKKKIAVDVKTTYHKSRIGFTLGSYTSFIRNNTKNILYNYNDYIKHYVICFVYTRENINSRENEKYSLDDFNKIICPYKDVKVFIQEKYKITGERPGSGNTANIGSFITSDINNFINGKGPFTKYKDGTKLCDLYWKNYDGSYKNIDDFAKKYNYKLILND